MTLRRTLCVMLAVGGLTAWAVGGTDQGAADPVVRLVTADDADPAAGGTHDQAAQRWRSNQPRHWRQVALGHR